MPPLNTREDRELSYLECIDTGSASDVKHVKNH